MKNIQPSVTYVYRGLGCDIPWQLLMREIAYCAGSKAPIAIVINCATSDDNMVPGQKDANKLQRFEKRLTIVDVARLAGVSKMTVSRVLNNRARVNPRIRARVKAVVEASGFSLNEHARALVLGRSA